MVVPDIPDLNPGCTGRSCKLVDGHEEIIHIACWRPLHIFRAKCFYISGRHA
nr:MAG TPA: hypothetical protein [Caudoviricetes sp.]